MKCHNCGSEIIDGTVFCPYCGGRMNSVPAETPVQPAKKKSHLGLWILTAVVCVLAIAVVAGMCTNWFGYYGPGTKIITAANNTLTAGSFTTDFTMLSEYSDDFDSSYSYSNELNGTMEMILDPEKRELMMYAEVEGKDATAVMAIYDGYYIVGSDGQYYSQDISDSLDEFFDAYESSKEMDWEELLNSINDDLYDEVSETINFQTLNDCIAAYAKKLNNDRWLKENAGYSSTTENGVKLYQFKPQNYTFLKASLECFENAFYDEDDYEDITKSLKNNKSELNSVDVELSFGVKGRKLVSYDFEIEYEHMTIEMEMDFSKIGETTIDESDLENMLEMAS